MKWGSRGYGTGLSNEEFKIGDLWDFETNYCLLK